MQRTEISMAKTTVLQAKVDRELKEKAQRILQDLNISFSEAISSYLAQITLQGGIPFEIKIPNDETSAALKEAHERKELQSANSIDELFEDLSR